MRKLLHYLLMAVILSFAGCKEKDTAISSLSMLNGGKIFAVPSGTIADQFVKKKFPDAKIIYFNTVLDCALAVKNGKADAAVYDQPVLKNIAAKNEGISVLSELLVDDQYGFAVRLKDTALKNTMDNTLRELKSNGTYTEMMKRWFPEKGAPEAMPEIANEGTAGTLKFGTAAVSEPMSFMDANRKVAGFDIEYASYIAKKLNKKLEIIDMEFGALLPALIAGKVDMVGAGLSITAERAKSVYFSESYYPSEIAAAVKGIPVKQASDENKKYFTINTIKDSKIGVLLGSIHDTYATKKYPSAAILQFQNVSDMLNALNSGKVDVAFYDDISLKDIFNKNEKIGTLAKNVYNVPIAAGFNKESSALRDQFNAFLQEIKSNGVYNDMVNRWMDKSVEDMPEIKQSSKNGILNVGIVSDLGMPFSLIKDGKNVGFDIELGQRFAASVGKAFVPVDMPFGSLLASISTKKIDIITASMMITEERKKRIDFSNPYFESGVSIIAAKSNIEPVKAGKFAGNDDLADKKIGVYEGTVHDAFVAKKYPKASILRYKSTADMMLSVRDGKIDAAFYDLNTARIMIKQNQDLGILSDNILSMPLGIGFSKKNSALSNEFNAFLKAIKANGSYETIRKRWLIDDSETAKMPSFKNNSSGKLIRAGVAVADLPYVAVVNGEYVGVDIELIKTFAAQQGYRLEIITMEFPSLIAALASGKVDLIADGIAISEERKKKIDFSESYTEFKTAVVVLKKNMAGYKEELTAEENTSFFVKISESFNNNIIREKRYLLIIDGLLITILISIFSAIFGTIFGGVICFMRMSKKKYLSVTASFYISLLRGTPVLVLLMIIYYIVFASVNINPVLVAILAFGLNFAAYVSEMFRTSIESIDRGQKEAGIAGGFTKIQTFIHIIMPQAMRHVLPVYKGEFISLVKMTSIVGYIAVQDLTKAGDIIRSRTFDAFFPLIMAAVIYLLIAWLLTLALDYVEISVDPKRKTVKREVEVAG